MFLPLQGGGQEGDGVSVGAPPCVQRPHLWVKISLAKRGEGRFSNDYVNSILISLINESDRLDLDIGIPGEFSHSDR